MIKIGTIKERARASLEHRLFGNVWFTLVILLFLYGIAIDLPTAIGTLLSRTDSYAGGMVRFPLTLVTLVISGPLAYGLARMFSKTACGKGKADIVDLLCGFREDIGAAFLLGLMRSVYVFLWTLLFIIPGIVKAYSYSMAFFIQQEEQDKDYRACLEKSAALTEGYKGKLFLLDLSFIGWYLVGLLCLGVGALWVSVYHMTARAHFYEELKRIKLGEKEEAELAVAESAEKTEEPFAEFSEGKEEKKEDLSSEE